jgi:hypothetical protein
MIVFFKNYKRTDRTYLSIQSVRHLFPDIDIRCLFLYDTDAREYADVASKFKDFGVQIYYDKKKWNLDSDSAAGSANNGYYFTEAINKIQFITSDIDDKILIIDEDTFFTSGETIRFLLDTEFDLACCYWPSPVTAKPYIYEKHNINGINGSILCINPKKLNNLFPIREEKEYIENILAYELVDKCLDLEYKVVEIPTRFYYNYYNDGVHTNSLEDIIIFMYKAGIPYKLLNQ